jgi:hypothetical protein
VYHQILLLLLAAICAAATAQGTKDAGAPSNQPEAASPTVQPPAKPPPSLAPLTIDQIRANLPATVAERFEFLRNQRKTTLDAISNTSTALATVESKLTTARSTGEDERNSPRVMSVDSIRADLARAREREAEAQRRLDSLKASKNAISETQKAEQELRDRQSFVSTVQGVLTDTEIREKGRSERNKTLTILNAEREGLSSQLLIYQRLLGSIDDMVNQLFIASDATNSFKLRMSIAFAALVGVVIVGFFGIAWSSDEIKKTIFANEAGIQFITVFSIVIAVILFGIIGVLESKELSALLGGLSGYILGKSRTTG